jgi:hypothetical protein
VANSRRRTGRAGASRYVRGSRCPTTHRVLRWDGQSGCCWSTTSRCFVPGSG